MFLKLEGVLLLLPCIVAGIYSEKSGIYFLLAGLLSIAIGFIFSARKPKNFTLYLKEGCIATSLSWVILSIFGALPFFWSGEIPSFTDALFETISGFTTTGASILSDVEALSKCMLFLAELYTLDRRNGSPCIPSCDNPVKRWKQH